MDVSIVVTTGGGERTYAPLTWRYRRALDEIGSAAFVLAADMPWAGELAAGQLARGPGFWGVIASIERAPDADGAVTLTVTLHEQTRQLAWQTAGYLTLAAGTTLAQAVSALLTGSGFAWAYGAGVNQAATVYAQSDGASRWTMLLAVCQRLGLRVLLTGPGALLITNTATGTATALAPAGDLAAGQVALLALSKTEQAQDLTTEIVPFGAGNARARVNLYHALAALPPGYSSVELDYGAAGKARGIRHVAGHATYGSRQRFVQYPRISPIANTAADIQAAAEAVQAEAVRYLADNATPTTQIAVTVGSAETLVTPAMALTIAHALTPATYYVLGVTVAFDADGVATQQLTVGDRLTTVVATGAERVVSGLERASVYQSHAQLFACLYQITYAKAVDQRTAGRFRWRFDEALTQLQAVWFDYQVLPLESTIKGLQARAIATTTDGAHSHTFSSTGHSHTMAHTHTLSTPPVHAHDIVLEEVTSAAATGSMWVQESPPEVHYVGSNPGATTTISTEDEGTTNPTTSAASASATGTGGVWSNATDMVGSGGAHSHSVTPEMSLVYGLHRDDSTNVPGVNELEYTLDGVTWTNLAASASMGGGWRRVGLHDALRDPLTGAPTKRDWLLQVRLSSLGQFEEYGYVAYNNTTLRVVDEAGTVVATHTLSYSFDRVLINRPRQQLVTIDTNTGRVAHYTLTGNVADAPTLYQAPFTDMGLDAYAIAPNGQEFAGFGDDAPGYRLGYAWPAGFNGVSNGIGIAAGGESLVECDGLAANDTYVFTANQGYYRRNAWRGVQGLRRVASPSNAQVWDMTLDGLIVVTTDTGTKLRLLDAALVEQSQFTPLGGGIRSVRVSAANTLVVLGADSVIRYYATSGALLGVTAALANSPRDVAPYAVEVQRQAMIDAQLSVRGIIQATIIN